MGTAISRTGPTEVAKPSPHEAQREGKAFPRSKCKYRQCVQKVSALAFPSPTSLWPGDFPYRDCPYQVS